MLSRLVLLLILALVLAVVINVVINVVGDVATAMGSTRVDVELNGEFKQLDLRYLNVWTRRDGRWQLIARQSAYKPK